MITEVVNAWKLLTWVPSSVSPLLARGRQHGPQSCSKAIWLQTASKSSLGKLPGRCFPPGSAAPLSNLAFGHCLEVGPLRQSFRNSFLRCFLTHPLPPFQNLAGFLLQFCKHHSHLGAKINWPEVTVDGASGYLVNLLSQLEVIGPTRKSSCPKNLLFSISAWEVGRGVGDEKPGNRDFWEDLEKERSSTSCQAVFMHNW